ncbi:hypothetical protein M758_7G004100 [Ceratodon purpureus]|uniref:GHMP kinase N-terminal domain-containing protein n=1 Tax=Ceratodon purpureus TaxID=3225 RepID=A0A8T0H0M2_CERPU|nr:hypothetical protein KC19_7G004300 [Ceratodon purpureus]KAG0609658.1 hypothetical protein M758_7G004100 [Ceratodon purpureus]
MAEAATLFAALPVVRAPIPSSSRTQCSMQRQRGVRIGGGPVQRVFGVGKGRVVALRPGLWRGICRAADQNSEGAATSPAPLEVVYDPQGRFEKLAMELNSSSSAPVSNLTLFSPSKVNVFLRITGKRPDGYHNLASLFHVISLGDVIKFSVSPSTTKDSLTTNTAGVPLDGKNLIIKAFNLYREKTGTKKYFWVHLDKQVPTGAGLGGGSGNAATALWAANQMNGNIVSEKELQEWSGEIGADCPFFFSQGAAYCTNKGEVVQNIPPPIPLDTPMVLIKPPEECSTVEVYKRFSMANVSDKNPDDLLREITEKGISQSLCVNDLEPPAFEVLPTLKALKERVIAASRGRYQAVFMSGRYILGLNSSVSTSRMQLISKRALQRRNLPSFFHLLRRPRWRTLVLLLSSKCSLLGIVYISKYVCILLHIWS